MRQPPMIKTLEQLKVEIKLLEALSEIEVAVRAFKKKGDVNVNPIDHHYMNMKCEISLLNASDPKYKVFLFKQFTEDIKSKLNLTWRINKSISTILLYMDIEFVESLFD